MNETKLKKAFGKIKSEIENINSKIDKNSSNKEIDETLIMLTNYVKKLDSEVKINKKSYDGLKRIIDENNLVLSEIKKEIFAIKPAKNYDSEIKVIETEITKMNSKFVSLKDDNERIKEKIEFLKKEREAIINKKEVKPLEKKTEKTSETPKKDKSFKSMLKKVFIDDE
ncbi:MAG: hypothetical protein ACOCXG_00975 [Nanoarchaeota archaeon]